MTQWFNKLVLLFIIIFLLAGCGAGEEKTVSNNSSTTEQFGKIDVNITWPQNSDGLNKVMQKIPVLTQAIQVQIVQGQITQVFDCIARPSNQTTSSKTYDKIPPGQTVVRANAMPNADCSGVSIASANSTVTVVVSQNVPASLTLASNISKIEVTPNPFQVTVGGTVDLTATAKNSNGQIVLLPTDDWTWTSSDSSKATVCTTKTDTCKVTGVAAAADPITITAKEDEFAVVGTSTGKVLFTGDGKPAIGDWPQSGHDAAHTGVADFALTPPLNLKWTFSSNINLFSPVAANGKVYAGGSDGKIYAIDITTGGSLWTYNTNTTTCCNNYHPAIDNGVLFALNRLSDASFKIMAIDTTSGGLKWEKEFTGELYSGMVIDNGLIYLSWINTGKHKLLAVETTTGNQKFDVNFGSYFSLPAAVFNGVILIYDGASYLSALEASTGTLKWKYTELSNAGYNSIVTNGLMVYTISDDQDHIIALDFANGTEKWKITSPFYHLDPPRGMAVSGNVLYVSNNTIDKLMALDATTGATKWEVENGVCCGVVIAGDTLYTGGGGNNLYARDIATGQQKWSYTGGTDDFILAGGLLITNKNFQAPNLHKLQAFEPVTSGGGINVSIN